MVEMKYFNRTLFNYQLLIVYGTVLLGHWRCLQANCCDYLYAYRYLYFKKSKMGIRVEVDTQAARQVSQRMLSTSANRQVVNRVPQKQKMFQEDNGVPVHLKGGTTDAILYRATMGLTIMGTGYVIYELIKAAVPQKKE